MSDPVKGFKWARTRVCVCMLPCMRALLCVQTGVHLLLPVCLYTAESVGLASWLRTCLHTPAHAHTTCADMFTGLLQLRHHSGVGMGTN